MVKSKGVNLKRNSVSSKKGTTHPIHVFRGGWENGSLNISKYRLVLSCSLETHKK